MQCCTLNSSTVILIAELETLEAKSTTIIIVKHDHYTFKTMGPVQHLRLQQYW